MMGNSRQQVSSSFPFNTALSQFEDRNYGGLTSMRYAFSASIQTLCFLINPIKSAKHRLIDDNESITTALDWVITAN